MALLSFIAGASISAGDAVNVVPPASGQLYRANPYTSSTASVVGISLDTVSSGALTRVVTDGSADTFSGLTPGSLYYLSSFSGTVVNYPTVAAQIALIGSGAYLTSVGQAISSTQLTVRPKPPIYVLSDSL
jgi:hypothetical protein